jgi:hypothetical protein
MSQHLSIVGTLRYALRLPDEEVLVLTVYCDDLNLEVSAIDDNHVVEIPLALLRKGVRVQITGSFFRTSPERHRLLYPDAPTGGIMTLESAALVT